MAGYLFDLWLNQIRDEGLSHFGEYAPSDGCLIIQVTAEDPEGGGILEFSAMEVLEYHRLQKPWMSLTVGDQTGLAVHYALNLCTSRGYDEEACKITVLSLGYGDPEGEDSEVCLGPT